MKLILIALMICLITSCGKSTSGGNESQKSPLGAGFSNEESELMERWLDKRMVTEGDILEDLLKLKHVDEEVLAKLDKYAEVKCFRGKCEVTKKDLE